MIKNITVIGAGYVGLSNALLLAQAYLKTQVTLFDINRERIDVLKNRQSPLQDREILDFLTHQSLNFTATDDCTGIYKNSDLVIIATPTNYEVATGQFDTSSVQGSIQAVREQNSHVPIIIKSTIPIGFTHNMHAKFDEQIYFMPEFLREGQALYDNLYPSRIILGMANDTNTQESDFAKQLLELYKNASRTPDVTALVMPTTEAEAVKLFANSYLATRIAFFNELDSFAEQNHLSSEKIITGVSLDPRIGEHYNNPSFGYGGYCLPKDTQQLKANYAGVPANLIHAVVDSNNTRKRFIAKQIIAKNPTSVGVYRLSMKKDADNFRDSAVLDIIGILKQHGVTVTIFEPALDEKKLRANVSETSVLSDCDVITDLATFKQKNDLIIANRLDEALSDVMNKVYSRDAFGYS